MNRRSLGFQLGVIGGTAALYLTNRLVLLPRAQGPALRFLQWYFADILAGAMILGIVNLLLLLSRRGWRLDTLGKIGPFLLLCGFAWEFLPLFYKVGAVFDWYDFLCYFIGGGLYYLLDRLTAPQET